MTYNWETELEEYDDRTWANFLVSEVVLTDLETFELEDTVSWIRLTVGWKSN